jgi:ABC-2 type transport system ATP-binding protein
VEFDKAMTKNQLNKIPGVSKIQSLENDNTWLIESTSDEDLRKTIAAFAQKNDLLTLTIRKEEKTLEEVFKELTK